jgi:hypothetical protein
VAMAFFTSHITLVKMNFLYLSYNLGTNEWITLMGLLSYPRVAEFSSLVTLCYIVSYCCVVLPMELSAVLPAIFWNFHQM